MDDNFYPFGLDELGLLEKIGIDSFDNLTALAATILGVPISLVSIIDTPQKRQYFKSIHGTLNEPYYSQRQTPLSHSFCKHVVAENAPLVVENAPQHPLVRNNGAIRDLGVMAYLGVPVHNPQMRPVGALCAISDKPRRWSAEDEARLIALSKCVDDAIRLQSSKLSTHKERENLSARDLIIYELKHRLNNIFASIQSMIKLSQKNYEHVSEFAADLSGRVAALAHAHNASINRHSTKVFSLVELVQDTLGHYAEAGYALGLDVADVHLEARYATPLGLILHELATNAIKHGAWKKSGAVNLSVTIMSAATQRPSLAFQWQETLHETPAMMAAKRPAGFGTKLINLSLKQIQAEYELSRLPTGLLLDFTLPELDLMAGRDQAA